jgi:hypothetical protein
VGSPANEPRRAPAIPGTRRARDLRCWTRRNTQPKFRNNGCWMIGFLWSAVARRRFGCAFLSRRSSNSYHAECKADAKRKRRQASALQNGSKLLPGGST